MKANQVLKQLLLGAALFASTAAVAGPIEWNGKPAPQSAAMRMIMLDMHTKHIDVERGETVFISRDGMGFAWRFDTFRPDQNFSLSDIAPNNVDTKGVRVFVRPNEHDRTLRNS